MSAKLGASTAMVGKIGTDSFGADTVKNFEAVGVNVEHLLTTDQAATGVAPIAVDESGQNSIVVVNGANDLLTVDELQAARPLLENAKVLVCQLEIKREVSDDARLVVQPSAEGTANEARNQPMGFCSPVCPDDFHSQRER